MNRPLDRLTAPQFFAHFAVEAITDYKDDGKARVIAECVAAGHGFAAVTMQVGTERLAFVSASAEECRDQMRRTVWAQREALTGLSLEAAMERHGFRLYDFTSTRETAPPAPRYSLAAGAMLLDRGEPVARLARVGNDSDGFTVGPAAFGYLAGEIVAALNLARAVMVRSDEGDSFPLGSLFDEDDGLEPDERAEIMAALARGETYRGGGGAAAEFTLTAEGVAA